MKRTDTYTFKCQNAVGALFSIEDCEYEYSDPREARPTERPRAQKLFDFILNFALGEWQYMIRVWKKPSG